jgi:hypothetical protein
MHEDRTRWPTLEVLLDERRYPFLQGVADHEVRSHRGKLVRPQLSVAASSYNEAVGTSPKGLPQSLPTLKLGPGGDGTCVDDGHRGAVPSRQTSVTSPDEEIYDAFALALVELAAVVDEGDGSCYPVRPHAPRLWARSPPHLVVRSYC